jgi:diaminopimelate decarboxylase
MRFASKMHVRHGVVPRTIVPGGGFGVADDGSGEQVSVTEWAAAAGEALRTEAGRYGLPLPELVVEPGRAIVGPAGVALYRVGASKRIPNARTYVSVDGGMADNIRPSLYGAAYSAQLANRANEGQEEVVAVAGKYCESGDILIPEIALPRLHPGDLLAVPMAGAYCLAMASNYNLAPRPAVVMVSEGRARLIRRRETVADMLSMETLPVPAR